ncbi:hypothetical protein H8S20_11310 [Clostridium sp. NSJ-6]|uniref:Uncharacterized protein n=1 Tax=Clostridium hominis TaxID=2763036 RepID=A0ABR7DDH3_9CLOT|nr:hypothetical protein [Clostridium hominis]MBC5629477.1 hypothetical protein [Clostridium hominis]
MYWSEANYDVIDTLSGDLAANEAFEECEDDEDIFNEELFGNCRMLPGYSLSYLISVTCDIINIRVINYKGANQGC